ncbi:hypothetical protein PHYSODRAFT_486298 [Phytophthora sojae]|uniref:Uncharacterized protein n=1 Tax=Phytophthora sojae (strain P6497) TaxID=1094619 RepID=G4Z0U0_PHYSP|nr:hypothetical protein PHYSODRAFT_486298 [Phytophthora sojae]EGZ22779.1 hypothetical protein PHYSODRAFT_486298 [Phytophthora sojae]|eukprot:XP_009518067.1 hypothetical protein PHYSODRAFT_486298 [Phytophthora sojae]
MKQKWATAREAEGRTGNDGPVRRPNHYSIMKDYWGDATRMNNRPHISTEDPDTTAAAGDAASADRTQGGRVEAGLSAVAKGFSEGLEALGQGLATQQTGLFREQSERAHAQTEQLLSEMQAQSERLRVQNETIRELLDLIRRDH